MFMIMVMVVVGVVMMAEYAIMRMALLRMLGTRGYEGVTGGSKKQR